MFYAGFIVIVHQDLPYLHQPIGQPDAYLLSQTVYDAPNGFESLADIQAMMEAGLAQAGITFLEVRVYGFDDLLAAKRSEAAFLDERDLIGDTRLWELMNATED